MDNRLKVVILSILFVLPYCCLMGITRHEEETERKALIARLENEPRLDCAQVKEKINFNPFTAEVVENIREAFSKVPFSEIQQRGASRKGELGEAGIGGQTFVFTLKSLPHLIFKLEKRACEPSNIVCDEKGVCVAGSLFTHFSTQALGSRILIDNCLDLLYVPAATVFTKSELKENLKEKESPKKVEDKEEKHEVSPSLWNYLLKRLNFWDKGQIKVVKEESPRIAKAKERAARKTKFSIENCPIFVQIKAAIGSSTGNYTDTYMYLYSQFDTHPRLLRYFKELFKQLTIFICKSGLWDIKYNNIPLDLSNGKIALVDVDGIGGHRALEGVQKLLYITSPELFDTILDTATHCLGLTRDAIMSQGELKEVRARMQNKIDEYKAYSEFLDREKIEIPDQPIVIDPHSLGLDDPIDIHIIQAIAKTINKELKEQAHKGGTFKEIRSVLLGVGHLDALLSNENLVVEVEKKFNLDHFKAMSRINNVFNTLSPKSPSIFEVTPDFYGKLSGNYSLIQV